MPSASEKKLIVEMKKLAAAEDINDQLKSMEIYRKKIFPNDLVNDKNYVSIISELLPTLIKFLDSENENILKGVLHVIADFTFTKPKQNTEIFVNAGIIPKLENLLSSTNQLIIRQSMVTLVNMAVKFQKYVMTVIPTFVPFLTSADKEFVNLATHFFSNVTFRNTPSISRIFEAGGVEHLIGILNSVDFNDACKQHSLIALTSIVDTKKSCQQLFDYGVLAELKQLSDRLFANAENTRKSEEEIKMMGLVIRFARNASLYGSDPIEELINHNFIPMIVEQISKGLTNEIKIDCMTIIKNIAIFKSDYMSTLTSDYSIWSILYNNMEFDDINWTYTALNIFYDIIKSFKDKAICRQKIRECDNLAKLKRLCTSRDKDVRKISKTIYNFVSSARIGERGASQSSDNNSAVAAVLSNNQRRKRQQSSEQSDGGSPRSKRTRMLPTEFRLSDDSSENNEHNDFDDAVENISHASLGNETDNDESDAMIDAPPENETNASNFEEKISIIKAESNVETIQSSSYPVRKPSPPGEINFSHNSFDASLRDGTNTSQHDVRKREVIPQAPIILTFPDMPTTDVVLQAQNNFAPIKCWPPHESLIHDYCGFLGLKYRSERFKPKAKFPYIITSNSIPDRVHSSTDGSGFSCLSILLTGSEESTETIQIKINEKFVENLRSSGNFDQEKIRQVVPPPLSEHLETITSWFNCRIIVYSNGIWEQYGNWDDSANQFIPIFVLQKSIVEENEIYGIVLSVKEN